MRNLIRPGMFLIVRLGLFLSIAVWVLSQSWAGFGRAGTSTITIVPLGVVLTFNESASGTLAGSVRRLDNLNVWGNWSTNPRFNGAFYAKPNTYYSTGFALPGLVYIDLPYRTRIAIHHWLIVVLFTLSYCCLKFVYRKTTTESDVDE